MDSTPDLVQADSLGGEIHLLRVISAQYDTLWASFSFPELTLRIL
jgi:hypothetical protein